MVNNKEHQQLLSNNMTTELENTSFCKIIYNIYDICVIIIYVYSAIISILITCSTIIIICILLLQKKQKTKYI